MELNQIIKTRHDENLLVVAAVEEYARRHKISALQTLDTFLKFGITDAIRSCYDTLHTQDFIADEYYREKNY